MSKIDHVKHKRKIVVPAPGLIGFIFSHRITPIQALISGKLTPTGKHILDIKLCFFWPGAYVEIHNNSDDDLAASFKAYVDKIVLIKSMCLDMIKHLNEGKGPFVRREFLNDATINDGFGGTLFMTADPDLPNNYCIFEISSCFKKYRHSGGPSVLKKYLKDLVSFINDAEVDLAIVKEKLDQIPVEEKKDEG